jgi:hypothetical protein
MEAEPLQGPPNESQVQRAMQKEILIAIETTNPGQLQIMRLREHFTERQAVGRLVKNRDLRWVFLEDHELVRGHTEEQYHGLSLQKSSFIMCNLKKSSPA